MDKKTVVQKLITELEAKLETAKSASESAAAHATDEESKADSKWDTQGIEASYLAAGQAEQSKKIIEEIQIIKNLSIDSPSTNSQISLGSLVQCESNGVKDWYFLSPVGGGINIEIDSLEITIVTLQSPLAQQIINKQLMDQFILANGSVGKIIEIF